MNMKITIFASVAACLISLCSTSSSWGQTAESSQRGNLVADNSHRWSQDLINIETARSMWLDNKNHAVTNYYERGKTIVRGRDDVEIEGLKMRENKLAAKEQHAQAAEEHRRLATARAERQALERLERVDLAGQITWPVPLDDPQFASGRRVVEEYFRGRKSANGHNSADTVRVQATLAELRRQLNPLHTQISETKYTLSKRFLGDLEVGVRYAGQTALASNP
jgi:hypothetical protein